MGSPLSTAGAPYQTIGKFLGLEVYSSDTISSVAYAPQEILILLAVAGVEAFHLSVQVALGVCALLAILIFSYEQTVHAYPNGGGAFIEPLLEYIAGIESQRKEMRSSGSSFHSVSPGMRSPTHYMPRPRKLCAKYFYRAIIS